MVEVLLVEDNPGDARLIAEHLRETSDLVNDYRVTHVERVDDAVRKLTDGSRVDIILSDISLPDSTGEDTLIALNRAAKEVPVIFMTGTNDEGLAVSAIHKGAQDYLVKGRIDGEVLARAIQYAIERKKFQNQLNEAVTRARLASQRAELLDSQKRQLIKLNRSKDDFISIASHQLRTPATAVKQYVGMFLEGYVGEVSPDQQEILKKAYKSNERQLTVINELLKTAQLDAADFRLEMRNCSVNELLAESKADLAPMLKLREQRVTFQKADDDLALADCDELRLVFDNLLENASKYSENGKRIRVSTMSAKGIIKITVADQGVGIKQEDLGLIFDKFSRVDNAMSSTVEGSGLGLYWVKRIVDLHNGTIDVESTPGKGSKFTVCLPLAQA